MRTISHDAAARLYHLGDDGQAVTILYGTLAEALAEAARQSDDAQDNLFIQTRDDVIAYRDLIDG